MQRDSALQDIAGAISKTAAGGEIDALDPAGYGAMTITKAITIDGGGGQVASISVTVSVIVRNNTGVSVTGGTVFSYQTNMIDDNFAGDGTPSTGTPLN